MHIESLESRKLRSAVAGDANGDHRVDVADFVIVSQHFDTLTIEGVAAGDFNADGVVNALDFNVLASNFGEVMTLNWNDANHTESLDDPANYVEGMAPGSGDVVVIDLAAHDVTPPQTAGSISSLAGLQINDNENANSYSVFSTIAINGNVSGTNVDTSSIILKSVTGNVSGTWGSIQILHPTGAAGFFAFTQ